MKNEPLWSSGFGELQVAAKAASNLAHTLTLTNHKTGPRRFETRFAFRDSAGLIVAAATIRRTTRYMNFSYEEQVLSVAQELANGLPNSQVRINGEPDEQTGYPIFRGDPLSWENEQNKNSCDGH